MTTPADLADLRLDIASARALLERITSKAALLTPDSPAPPGVELYTAYNSAFMGNHSYYPVGVDANGNPGSPPVPAQPFMSQAGGIVIWGTDTEHQAILTDARGGGEQWAALVTYGSSADPTIAYPEEIIKCDWTNLGTGTVRDMAGFTLGPTGGIMCPQLLPASGRYRLRQWGWVWNSPTGARVRTFYWQADYQFGISVDNPAWVKDAQRVRAAIKYSEAWYDESVGWVRGSAPTLPWIAGAPRDVNVTYQGWAAFGKNAGTLWRYDYPDYRVALARVS